MDLKRVRKIAASLHESFLRDGKTMPKGCLSLNEAIECGLDKDEAKALLGQIDAYATLDEKREQLQESRNSKELLNTFKAQDLISQTIEKTMNYIKNAGKIDADEKEDVLKAIEDIENNLDKLKKALKSVKKSLPDDPEKPEDLEEDTLLEVSAQKLASFIGRKIKSILVDKADFTKTFNEIKTIVANSTASDEGIDGDKSNNGVNAALKLVVDRAEEFGFANPRECYNWLQKNKNQIQKILGDGALLGVEMRAEQDSAAQNRETISLDQAKARVAARQPAR